MLLVTTAHAQNSPDTLQNTDLKSEVYYDAEDSIVFLMQEQKVLLFGKAKVKFESTTLVADYMEFSFRENTVFAKGMPDSTGKIIGKPTFNDGEQEIEASEITYNFKTKKGIIKEVRTQQGEGYVHMGVSKKHANDEIHLENGKYTTCENDDPHYYFKLRKAIVIPDDKIVSGPVNLVVAGIPTPLGLPFGFFPNKKRESKGIVIPQYGESPVLGFFLLNGGYYFPIGKKEKADMQILGDIYSRGSWGGKTITRYNSRYKANGALNLSYTNIRISDPEFPDYRENKEFFVRWNHNQDPKAHPYRRFSANVNAGTRNNFQNSFNTMQNDYLSNTFQSNIAYSYSFPNKPFNISVNARHNQNSLTGMVNFTLPEVTFNLNRIYPFAGLRKNPIGPKKFYENIGFIYSNNFKNDITIASDQLAIDKLDQISDYMRNGMRHTATLSTTVKMIKQRFTFNPTVSLTERWYLQTIQKIWDNDNQVTITDTLNGFKRNGDYNASFSLTTKLFTFYKYKGKKQTVIRHVITPSLNFSIRPDFSSQQYGYFGPGGTLASYSPFDIGIYGKAPSGNSGLLAVNVINNIEMKYKSKKDTITGYKKIILIENFAVQGAYNIFADSLNFTNINLSGRTTLYKNIGLVYSGIIDPYVYNNGIKTDQLKLNAKSGIGEFVSNSFALTASFQSKSRSSSNRLNQLNEEDREEIRRNQDAYVDFSVPWTFSINYNIRTDRVRNTFTDTILITQAIIVNGDISLTTNWKAGFSTGYDFVNRDFSYTQINLFRDLHCWEMRFNWIPFGIRKSYMIQINVKAAMLQDLKLMRRRSWFDTF